MKKLNNKKGISLIVLVITIIVMIVLAAAIILSLSSSGIIGKAGQAQKQSDYANAKQVVSVSQGNWLLDEQKLSDEFEGSFGEYAESELEKSGFAITDKITDDKLKPGSYEVMDDGTIYVYPTIPEGFVASKIASEDQVSEGLVIYELASGETTISDWTTTATGKTYPKVQAERNQFVWVPVEGKLDTTEEIDQKVVESIEENSGFYIARYEAGIPQNGSTSIIDGTQKPVSRKDATVWNNIPWDALWTESDAGFGNPENNGAAKVANSAYDTSSIKSHLIYNTQWDLALTFILKYNNDYITNGIDKGYYGMKSAPIPTGSVDDYAANNIYDMAGNVEEWTQKGLIFAAVPSRVMRGEGYTAPLIEGYGISAEYSTGWSPSTTHAANGFRVALYLK